MAIDETNGFVKVLIGKRYPVLGIRGWVRPAT
jgi:hypothetical protein